MLFYQISVLADLRWLSPDRKSAEWQDWLQRLTEESRRDYHKSERKRRFVCVDGSDQSMTFFAFLRPGAEETMAADFAAYMQGLEISFWNFQSKEVCFRNVELRLSLSKKAGWIEDARDTLAELGLVFPDARYRETLLHGDETKEHLIRQTKSLFFEETLLPELERIYQTCACPGAGGHPVHYIIRCSDQNKLEQVQRILLEALYANRRIRSKRVCNLWADGTLVKDRPDYETLYQSCCGGTVVVHLPQETDADSDRIARTGPWAAPLGSMVKKFRNHVLTVFCMPETYPAERLLERLDGMVFVELRENRVSGAKAREHLELLARECRLEPDRALWDRLENDTKPYDAARLRQLFQAWLDEKLRTSVYPQYREVCTLSRKAVQAKPKGSAIEELDRMTGLREAKAVIHRALHYDQVQKLYRQQGIPAHRPAMHMVFTGNPGTAKTTVARLFARILQENGLLDVGELHEVGRADLVGRYVGWTAQLVQEQFEAARGSVLFIDEAYSLLDDKGGLFGDEAINAIVQEMENNRDNMVVIFAGYPEKMEQFLRRNPGLRSRIAFHVSFPDYETEELVAIARHLAEEQGLCLLPSACEKLRASLHAARQTPDFGNGRYVRNLLEQAQLAQADRIVTMNPEDITETVLRSLTAEDIPAYNAASPAVPNRIGFAMQ